MKTKWPTLLKSWQKEAMWAAGKNLMNRIPNSGRTFNAQAARDSARTITAMLSGLFAFDAAVNRQPARITDSMPEYVAQANRILWERWEFAALTLFNLRGVKTTSDRERRINRKAVNHILRAFPDIDRIFPSDRFEPEFEEEVL